MCCDITFHLVQTFIPLSSTLHTLTPHLYPTPSHRPHPHSPTLGGDFLTDLDLPTVNCIVGGAALRSTNFGSVERRGAPSLSGSDLDHHTQLRIITEVHRQLRELACPP